MPLHRPATPRLSLKTERLRLAAPALVVVLTFLAFQGTLLNGFVNWDDRGNIVGNSGFHGLGWKQLAWMFTTFDLGHYQPLSWLSLGFDYTVWGQVVRGMDVVDGILEGDVIDRIDVVDVKAQRRVR